MEKKYLVGIVSYLNTKPLVLGIEESELRDKADFFYGPPAELYDKFLKGELDVALLPVVVLKAMEGVRIVGDYCIGTKGEVGSVGVVCNQKIEELHTIFLDKESKTSNALLQIIVQQHWKKNIVLKETAFFEKRDLGFGEGSLVIGDKAFVSRRRYAYYYDLGKAWHDFCGKPFVFAVWVSGRVLGQDFLSAFNAFQKNNLTKIDQIVLKQKYEAYDLGVYYKHNISYDLDEAKKTGMNYFLSFLN